MDDQAATEIPERVGGAIGIALTDHRPVGRHHCSCRWEGDDLRIHLLDVLAPALLPVVREIAADELRAAAEWLNADPDKGGAPFIAGDNSVLFPDKLEIAQVVTWASASLRDRADGLTGRTT